MSKINTLIPSQNIISGSTPKHKNITPNIKNKENVVKNTSKNKKHNSGLANFIEFISTTLGLTIFAKKALELPAINPDMTLKDINIHFKNIFLNDRLSLGETKVIIDRYKKLNEIQNDEEYIKAVFKDAKSNYGLQNTLSEIKLVPEISKTEDCKIDGNTDPLGCITISTQGRTREELFNTIHHELRHVKQRVYAFNINPNTYVKYSQPKNVELSQKCFEYFLGKPDIMNIPKKHREYAKKCLDGITGYQSISAGAKNYATQFVEKDAFNTSNTLCTIMKIA